MVGDPRRLRGHNATATFCIASRDRPGLIATAGEDGCVCWFDMRCKDVLFVMLVGEDPISSLCFKPGNEDIIYVSSGTEVKAFDVHSVSKLEGGQPSDERRVNFRTLVPTLPHTAQPSILLAASWKWLESHNYNKEEINQIACNSRSCFLAAADDSGNVKIVDIRQQCLYKTLRAGHTSICTSVQFLPWRPWEVITGGLDSKLVTWDFSKGCPRKIVDFSVPDTDGGCSAGQSLNPAFVHALAVPEVDMVERVGKVCVVARGDGVVEVIDIESELASSKSKNSLKPHKGAQSKAKGNASSVQTGTQDQNRRKKLCLDNSLGGHTASASCVAFSMFGEKGKHIVSGGNDKSVKVWDWCRYFDDVQTSSNLDLMHLNINLSKKVNWLCTTPADSENLIVCDTSKVVKVYTVA